MLDAGDKKILVVFATHNGAATLPAMLRAYETVQAPKRSWAMVIVDNGSTDETPQIIEQFSKTLPILALKESRPGKNRALNTALEAVGTQADLYIFTDDDAIPAEDFLASWEATIEYRPDNELFGAVVEPCFPEKPPTWLSKFSAHFAELYAKTHHVEGEIKGVDIYGPNMAVRGSVLQRGYQFNEAIGPNATSKDYPMGSETEFCQRAADGSSYSPWFAASPRVLHIVRPFQMTREFVGKRAYRHGRGTAMRLTLNEPALLNIRPSLKARIYDAVLRFGADRGLGLSLWEYNWRKGYHSWIAEHRSAD